MLCKRNPSFLRCIHDWLFSWPANGLKGLPCNMDVLIRQFTLNLKRNATFLHGFFLGPRVRVMWPWIMGNLHIGFFVEMMYNPRFTGIHSSPKERQLPKCCVSFDKECTSPVGLTIWPMVCLRSSEPPPWMAFFHHIILSLEWEMLKAQLVWKVHSILTFFMRVQVVS